jgi:hypothetical protein
MPSELPCKVSSMNSGLPLDRSTIFLSGFAPKRLTIMSNSIYNGWRMEDVWLDK